MDIREILRYLGVHGEDPQLQEMILRAEKEILSAANPKHIAKRFPLLVEEKGVTVGGTFLPSETLASHLRGCEEAFLFAFTLGPGVDTLIRRYELMEMPMVPVLQACAAAYTEECADSAQEELERYAEKRGLYLRPRYSPGYGDFSLTSQRFFFNALRISKEIGVTLTDSCLMLPMKSITAIVGLSPDPSLCHVGKCMTCSMEQCPFRKTEKKEAPCCREEKGRK